MTKRRQSKRYQEQPQRVPLPALLREPAQVREAGELQALRWQVEQLTESAAELERQLAAEDVGWIKLTGGDDRELDRDALKKISSLARWMYIKNPLIKRGVEVQSHYVFGQDCTIRAEDPEVNDVVQAFLDDAKNQAELTSHQARLGKEAELTLFGNLLFAFFVNKASGRTRVRTMPIDEIDDIICNPEDAKDPWYYKRSWQQRGLEGVAQPKTAYYPDWRYRPSNKPASINGQPVQWDTPVYHVKTGGLSDMKFGISEVYAAIDWAKAYKCFLEDWATLTRAYSRFAWKLTTPGGKAGVAAAKTRLSTTLGSTTGETQPPPVTGSTFIGSEGVDLQPLRIGGANVSAEDGRRLLLMVAAGLGLPETFFGDVSVGTLATANSLDRPTELKMLCRQALWAAIYRAILAYATEQAVRAGKLKGAIEEEDDGTPVITLPSLENDENGEPIERDASVTVTFPPLLEHDIQATVTAIVDAATLKGVPAAGTIDEQTLSRLLLQALGVQDIDAVLDVLFPPDEELGDEEDEEPETPAPVVPPPPAAEEAFTEAVRELREAVRVVLERHKEAA